ncbi:MAG: hypothetical protein KJ057_01155 [Phycisphaerae bacterium]|nr:hypothetical protein [Phycisphaerae bacterium]MCL4717062.1 hypothetical protein [Phycisphaerae bacterium]
MTTEFPGRWTAPSTDGGAARVFRLTGRRKGGGAILALEGLGWAAVRWGSRRERVDGERGCG